MIKENKLTYLTIDLADIDSGDAARLFNKYGFEGIGLHIKLMSLLATNDNVKLDEIDEYFAKPINKEILNYIIEKLSLYDCTAGVLRSQKITNLQNAMLQKSKINSENAKKGHNKQDAQIIDNNNNTATAKRPLSDRPTKQTNKETNKLNKNTPSIFVVKKQIEQKCKSEISSKPNNPLGRGCGIEENENKSEDENEEIYESDLDNDESDEDYEVLQQKARANKLAEYKAELINNHASQPDVCSDGEIQHALKSNSIDLIQKLKERYLVSF